MGQSEHSRGPSFLDIENYSFKRLCYISLRTIVCQVITSLVVVDEFCVTHTAIAQISISYINIGSLFIKLEKQASSNLAISWWLTKNYNYRYLPQRKHLKPNIYGVDVSFVLYIKKQQWQWIIDGNLQTMYFMHRRLLK